MNVLFLSLGGILVVAILLNVFVLKSYNRDKKNVDEDFAAFKVAVNSNNDDLVESIGTKLIYNKHLKQYQLNYLSTEIEKRKTLNQNFEELRLLAYNKRLHYERTFPSSGSSGGKKQSW